MKYSLKVKFEAVDYVAKKIRGAVSVVIDGDTRIEVFSEFKDCLHRIETNRYTEMSVWDLNEEKNVAQAMICPHCGGLVPISDVVFNGSHGPSYLCKYCGSYNRIRYLNDVVLDEERYELLSENGVFFFGKIGDHPGFYTDADLETARKLLAPDLRNFYRLRDALRAFDGYDMELPARRIAANFTNWLTERHIVLTPLYLNGLPSALWEELFETGEIHNL